jgi:Fe-S-cluster containining protein
MSFDEIIHCLSAAEQKVVRDMTALLDDIDRQTEKFSVQTGLKCKSGCGACCENPDVETTVAEVMPLAVYLWSSSLAEAYLSNPSKSSCVFYKPDPVLQGQGRCGIYAYRPGLCRLFGFASRKDKHGKPELMTCKLIKDNQPQACQRTQEALRKGLVAPLLTTHAFSVSNIDPVHGQKLLPINQAICQAVEKIGYRIHVQNKY